MKKAETHFEDSGPSQTSENQSDMDGKYLTFFTSGQSFGVPIADVVQIVGMQAITEMPQYPDHMKGIINLRGSIIPVIDVRLRLNIPEAGYNERTCIIVTMIRQKQFGFIVDAVDEVTEISDSSISAPPESQASDASGSFLTGIAKHEGRVILLMDTEKMLTDSVLGSVMASI